MDLILWRHAEASAESDSGDDLDRALTAKGERQAERMAAWLNHRLAESTRIIVSPALRCQQTAHALGRKFRTLADIAPGASAQKVLASARWPEAAEPVLVVGHQPSLGWAASLVLGGSVAGWQVKKGTVWWLRHRLREGSSQVVLQAVQAPDCL